MDIFDSILYPIIRHDIDIAKYCQCDNSCINVTKAASDAFNMFAVFLLLTSDIFQNLYQCQKRKKFREAYFCYDRMDLVITVNKNSVDRDNYCHWLGNTFRF